MNSLLISSFAKTTYLFKSRFFVVFISLFPSESYNLNNMYFGSRFSCWYTLLKVTDKDFVFSFLFSFSCRTRCRSYSLRQFKNYQKTLLMWSEYGYFRSPLDNVDDVSILWVWYLTHVLKWANWVLRLYNEYFRLSNPKYLQ